VTGGLAALLVAGHNLLDGISAARLGAWAPLWTVLHAPGFLSASPDHTVFLAYPLIPWVGVMALGWCLGAIYAWPAERRQRWLVRTGAALTAAFVVLRAINLYGDPAPWAAQPGAVLTVASFLNTTKYPPSLLFLLMTLGPALILLRLAEAPRARWLEPARIIGKVPLFYFLVHLALIHALAVLWSAVRYGSVHGMFESPSLGQFPITVPPDWGFALPGVYAAWLAVVLAMYPLCRWYAALKQRRTDWWLSYL
jgi:uncharacterized membrane protein